MSLLKCKKLHKIFNYTGISLTFPFFVLSVCILKVVHCLCNKIMEKEIKNSLPMLKLLVLDLEVIKLIKIKMSFVQNWIFYWKLFIEEIEVKIFSFWNHFRFYVPVHFRAIFDIKEIFIIIGVVFIDAGVCNFHSEISN